MNQFGNISSRDNTRSIPTAPSMPPPRRATRASGLCWRLLTSLHGWRRHFLASKSVREAFETVFDHRDGVIKAMIAIA